MSAGACAASHPVSAFGAGGADSFAKIVVPAGKSGTVEIPVTVSRATIDTGGATNARSIKVVGQRGDRIVEVLDAYPSKPQGLSRCQSGSETYFRVLDVRARKEVFARLVDSCLVDRVQAADPLITRSPDGGEVTLHGLYSSFTLRISPNGVVMVAP
ncbi:hypothetical protein [Sphingomonas endolithica]|uniref:hypothetical protein n=1 Tax=Sphingomonas endolithica TaxID=2972485 RepID=UPI0021AEAA95|nr:hypothetical protein [Sphingomonas sp. ZFBP2030]